MDYDLISVIIPVYNVEKYLRKCVDSVIGQTYTNLEIILVDDGSPDACGAICDEYAETDKRVRVIHKPNGGLSSARNAGVDLANGEWLGFVDSDDFCLPEMYEKLYNAARRESADMAICGYTYVDEQGLPLMDKDYGDMENCALTGDSALRRLAGNRSTVWVTAFNKLYKCGLLTVTTFPEGRIHEDEFAIHHLLDKCERVVAISDALYNYVQRDNSIMSSAFTIKRLDAYYAFWDRYNFFEEKWGGLEPCTKRTFDMCCGHLAVAILKLNWRKNKAILKPLYRKMLLAAIKKRHLRAGKLFIMRHKWMYYALRWAWYTLNDARRIVPFLALSLRLHLADKPRIILLATPVHGNLGDHAIVYAERAHFAGQGKSGAMVEVPNDLWIKFRDRISKRIKPQDTVVIDGGGNLGTLWIGEDDKITDIISRFHENEIIIFPQTCYYNKTPSGQARIERNKAVYSAARDLTVMLRDKVSYDFFVSNFPGVKAVLTKDMVFTVSDAPKQAQSERSGVLLCFRTDVEKVVDDKTQESIKDYLTQNGVGFRETTTVISKRVTAVNRNRELFEKWREFAACRLVITDRLHGMIFAAITETPCIALDNRSGKVSGSYEFIKDLDYIRFVKSPEDVLSMLMDMLGKYI